MKKYLGIDLGGTKIAVGVVREDGELLHSVNVPTQAFRPADEIIETIVYTARKAVESFGCNFEEIEGVGIGSPGIVNGATGVVEYANNLNFSQTPLAQRIESALGKKTILDNDANAAAYGEYTAGCGRGCRDFAAVTLGTGIGGGLVLDGKIHHGFNYGSAEFGHEVICVDGESCPCGKKGCFEAYCSASALIRQTKAAMLRNPSSLLWELCNQDLGLVNGKTAFDGMRAGDGVSVAVVDKFIYYLSVGISNIINGLQPEILCIGGGLSREGDTLIEPLNRLVVEQTYILDPQKRTKIKAAKLGNEAGIIGAALLCRQFK